MWSAARCFGCRTGRVKPTSHSKSSWVHSQFWRGLVRGLSLPVWGSVFGDPYRAIEDRGTPVVQLDSKKTEACRFTPWMIVEHVPCGKHTKNYGKSPFFMGKSTISMVIFNSYVSHYQRVKSDLKPSANQTLGSVGAFCSLRSRVPSPNSSLSWQSPRKIFNGSPSPRDTLSAAFL